MLSCVCVCLRGAIAQRVRHSIPRQMHYSIFCCFFLFVSKQWPFQSRILYIRRRRRYDLSRQLKTNFAKEKQNNLKAHSINKVIKWIFMWRLGQNSNFKNNDYHVKLIKMWIRRIWIRQVPNNSNSKKETENQMKQMMFLPSNRDKMYMQQQMIISNEMQC